MPFTRCRRFMHYIHIGLWRILSLWVKTFRLLISQSLVSGMKIVKPRIQIATSGLLLCLTALLTGCDDAPSTLRGAGRAAVEINQLWWFMLVAGSIIYIGVMALLIVAYRRRRTSAPTTVAPEASTIDPTQATEPGEQARVLPVSADDTADSGLTGTRMVVWGGIVMPAIVLTSVYLFTVETLWTISAQRTTDLPTIEVIGHQWWWEVRYPDEGIVTANELIIPAGEPVQIRLSSADVNHSFWVPELHGKLDMIPGRVNTFWIEAEEPDTYWGICAEFCGIQHANMYFLAIALPPQEYAAWLAAQQQPAAAPMEAAAEAGQQIFLDIRCGSCHAIAGTAANGQLGPDLTHLMSRRTLASGILENTPENLTEWLVHPQQIKPGSLMPATPPELDEAEVQALVSYLLTLE